MRGWVAWGVAGWVLAGAATPGSAQMRSFAIGAQPVASALGAFSAAAGVQVSAPAGLTAGRSSPGVQGALTAEAALGRLLAGTGLVGRIEQGTVVLAAAPVVRTGAAGEIELPPVEVGGRRAQGGIESGYGPVRGLDGTRVTSGANNLPIPVDELPRQVSVITPERIQLGQPTTPVQLFQDVSSVVFTGNGEGPLNAFTTVRGLSAGRYLVDGLSSRDFGNVGGLFSNVERVEIFKGPSAFLQGATNLGGTINFVTKKPLQTPQYVFNVGVGFTGELNRPRAVAGFDMTGPISETLSYRAIGQFDYAQGYESPGTRENVRGNLSLSTLWRPDEDTSVLAVVDYFRGDINTNSDGVPARGSVLPNGNGLNIPFNQRYVEPNLQRGDITFINPRLNVDRRINDVWSASLGLSYSHLEQRVIGVSSIGQVLLANDRTLNRSGAGDIVRDDELTARVSLTGKFDVLGRPNVFVAGADTDHYVLRFGQYKTLRVAPIDIVTPTFGDPVLSTSARAFLARNSTFQTGVFANDRITILPHLDLFGGIRADFVDLASGVPGGAKGTVGATGITSNAGIAYEFLPESRVYFAYNEAFNPPATSLSRTGSPFPPETGSQYEVGFKTRVNDRIAVQGALFRAIRANVLTPDPASLQFSVATGEVRVRGGELEATGTILPGWQGVASYTYLDPQITKDNGGNVGRRVADVPRHSLRLFTVYEVQSGRLEGVGFGGGMRYNSSSFVDNANSVRLPDYAVFDATAYYKFGRYRLQANVYNLFDKHYYPSGRSASTVYPGQPFTALVTLSARL